jgi:hypothetical protein
VHSPYLLDSLQRCSGACFVTETNYRRGILGSTATSALACLSYQKSPIAFVKVLPAGCVTDSRSSANTPECPHELAHNAAMPSIIGMAIHAIGFAFLLGMAICLGALGVKLSLQWQVADG